MVEAWRPIPKWEGYYEVSDHGRIRSLDRFVTNSLGVRSPVRGRILNQYEDGGGYLYVTLCRNGYRKRMRVHRMVAKAFLGDLSGKKIVCHNDGDEKNNRLDNLRWDTHSSNNYDKVIHGSCHETNKTQCPRGHALTGGNLAPWHLRKGRRTCLACARARAYCKKYGLMDQFKEYADKYFDPLPV